MPLFVHIGLHKTGSTSIQRFMTENVDLLQDHGLIYPSEGRKKQAHHSVSYEVGRSPSKKTGGAGLRSIVELARSNPHKRYLISSEGFDTLKSHEIVKLRSALDGIDVIIIAYLRPYPDFISSRYSQRVKSGSFIDDFDVFFSETIGNAHVDNSSFGFLPKMKAWANVFGWPAMRLQTVQRSALVGSDLLADILMVTGVDYKALASGIAPGSADRFNETPGWQWLELIRALHAAASIGRSPPSQNRKATAPIGGRVAKRIKAAGLAVLSGSSLDGDRGLYLTSDQYDRAIKLYDAHVEEINSYLSECKIGARDQKTFVPRTFLPSAERVPEQERLDFYEKVLFRLLPTYGIDFNVGSRRGGEDVDA